MSESMKSEFKLECEKKFDELVAWAVLNAEECHELSASDFDEVRRKFCHIAINGSKAPAEEPEPAEGGAQYVNVTPAPWP